MWTHFGGTLTLRSDDGRGRVVMVDSGYIVVMVDGGYMSVYAWTRQLHVAGKNYGWTEGSCGQELPNRPR